MAYIAYIYIYILDKYIFYSKKGQYILNPPNELYQSSLVSIKLEQFGNILSDVLGG